MRIKLENNHVLIAMPDPEEALELHPLGSGLICLPKKQFQFMLTQKAIHCFVYLSESPSGL